MEIGKIHNDFPSMIFFFEFLPRRALQRSSFTIDSYGEYLFAISMDIYKKLSVGPQYTGWLLCALS